jgi:hypothetical protein
MKKRKNKKKSLATLFISGLSLFLILLSILYTYSSGKAIDRVGNLAITIDNENNQALSSILFYDITVAAAKNWSERFKVASNALKTLAENIQIQLTKNNIINQDNKSKLNLTKYKGRDFFIDNTNSIAKCYWGGKENVPQHVINQLSSLINISNQFVGIKKLYPEIYNNIYFISPDNFTFGYPMPDKYFRNIKNYNFLNEYYTGFNKFPYQTNDKNMKVLLPCTFYAPSLDISNLITMSVETALYDKGKLLGYAGIDFNFEKIYEKLKISKLSAGMNLKGEKVLLESFFFLINKDGTIIIFPREHADLFSIPPENLVLKLDHQVF